MANLKDSNPAWIDLSTLTPQSKTGHITRQFRDLPYGAHRLQKLDVYLPERGEGPFPFIVNVHGGFRNLHRDVFGTIQVPEQAVRQSNPTTFIQNGIAPVYLQQGTLDPAVAYTVVKAFGDRLAEILPPEDLVFDVLEGAKHAGADEAYFLQKNVDPILRFFERHLLV